MNRDERSKLMIHTRQFLSIAKEQCDSYRDFLEKSVQLEANKLENMPESLQDTDNSIRISETLEALDSAKEAVDEIADSLEQLPNLLDIRIRKPRQKEIYRESQPVEFCNIQRTTEKRTERLQLVITPTLATTLKIRSSQMGISTNELINRILLQHLNS